MGSIVPKRCYSRNSIPCTSGTSLHRTAITRAPLLLLLTAFSSLPVSAGAFPGATQVITVTPSSLSLTAAAGGSATEPLSIASTNQNSQNWTASASGGNWISVSPTSGKTPGTVTVTTSASGLNPGIYNGTVTIGSSGPNISIPVT